MPDELDALDASGPPEPQPVPKNPSVFPAFYAEFTRTGVPQYLEMGGGLSLRDLTALVVIHGVLCRPGQSSYTPQELANLGYSLADAVAERRQRQ